MRPLILLVIPVFPDNLLPVSAFYVTPQFILPVKPPFFSCANITRFSNQIGERGSRVSEDHVRDLKSF